jgi:sodium/hydrogen exchanger 8
MAAADAAAAAAPASCGAASAYKHQLTLEDQRLGAFFMTLLLVICFIIGYLLHSRHITWFPEAGAFLIIGVIAGSIFHSFGSKSSSADQMIFALEDYLKFDKKSFFLIFLPPIIFESAYGLKSRKLFANLDAIMMLAIYGTLASSIIVGVLVKFAGDAGWSHAFGWLPSMLFGSLISATDPVSVLAVFAEVNADINLYSIVYGESVLNDAVALVMYQTVLTFKENEFNVTNILIAVGSFLRLFISSALIGILFALLLSVLFRYSKLHESRFFFLEIALVACVPYGAWMLSDGIHLSGIVAVLTCGIGMSHWTQPNVSLAAHEFTFKFFKVLALLSETLVFVALGVAVAITQHLSEWGFFFLATLICFVARIFVVYPVGLLCNSWRKHHPISQRAQFVLWLSGLRGPVAFALAFDTRNDPFFAEGQDGAAIFSATTFIVFFTVFSIGSPAAKILKALDVLQGEAPETEVPVQGFSRFILDLDEKYIRRWINHLPGFSPQEIELYETGIYPHPAFSHFLW